MDTIVKTYKDFSFEFINSPQTEEVIDEIFSDNYKVFQNKINFMAGDIVIDIGANIGAFSILLAKSFPSILIYAIEPIPETYLVLCENIKLNNVDNIVPVWMAISDIAKNIVINYSEIGPGGASSYVKDIGNNTKLLLPTISFDDFINEVHIQKCKLLKIDCEGAEYDILYNSKLLNRVEYLVGEFHTNSFLRSLGHSPESLAAYCSTIVKHMMYYEYCIMHE